MTLVLEHAERTALYEQRLREGLEFQDLVADRLWYEGIALCSYASRKHARKAENRMGVEIKLDNRWPETGRLYFETEERANASAEWQVSGIYRESAWLLAIGNEACIWIFGVKTLRRAHESKRYAPLGNATSRGFGMPIADADRIAEKIVRQGEERNG